ncbi:MAG TPA: ATP-dependent helicase [Iamia sp.]|nr:ATP-dependent helicase [Iamia sp.]
MTDLTPEDWLASKSLVDAIVIAPPGCGKTELLARRAAACVTQRLVRPGRKVLALTFTNKARDNLAERLSSHSGRGFRRHVDVMNFHGLGLHLYLKHRYVLDDQPRALTPDERALARLRRHAFNEHNVPRAAQQEVVATIRQAKAGAFSDDEVLNRLAASGSHAALTYEVALREADLLDHDDVLRYGLQIIRHPGVAAARYDYVLVDEAQDLTRVQFDLVEPIGQGCTVFAGDRAQGIYTFAGADPAWVFDRIGERNPVRVTLDKSYRSSPEVLEVVSAVARELGGEALTSADPDRWANRGRAGLAEFEDLATEARWLIALINGWIDEYAERGEEVTIGVLSRMKPGGRRDVVLAEAARVGLAVETWDHPLHRPEVVQLLRAHLDGVLATVADPVDQVEELYLRCYSDVPPENASTLTDLRDAADELADLIREAELRELIERIRVGSDIDVPVGPGVHLLTGHAGKGQGFDKVIILGFEDDQIPSFFVAGLPDDDPRVREELALLHVMASRAKEELVFTVCRRRSGWNKQPSRWLNLFEQHLVRLT